MVLLLTGTGTDIASGIELLLWKARMWRLWEWWV